MTRVFEIGPVFRAEDSNTNRHCCEFVGMDFEMEIKQHYHEVLEVLGDALVTVFDNINKHCAKELAAVGAQYPFQPLKYRPLGQTLVIPFAEAVRMLKEDGMQMGEFDDFTYVAHQTHTLRVVSVLRASVLLPRSSLFS